MAAAFLFPKRTPRVGYPWLTNREMRSVMDVTAIRDRNVLLDSVLYPLIEYRGTAPLYVCGTVA